MGMHAHHDIFHRGHVLEQTDVLIGPGDASLCHTVRRITRNIMAIEQDLSLLRGVKTGDAVEEGGLPGAIGANDAVDGGCFDVQINIGNGREAAKSFGYFVAYKDIHGCLLILW